MNPMALASAGLADFMRWGADAQGSTRPLGLMRIALAIIVFARFGGEVSFYHADRCRSWCSEWRSSC